MGAFCSTVARRAAGSAAVAHVLHVCARTPRTSFTSALRLSTAAAAERNALAPADAASRSACSSTSCRRACA
jgi:hypothetical protein